jgi:benzoylformate decarboxylase
MTTVFGNPGSTELRFLRDWPDDFRYVTALHEGCAVAMADAYAQVTGTAAFVNLHSAGGLGNAMGTIFSAFKNQTPLVITAGQQTRALFPAVPFLYADDATMLPRPYVKFSCEPSRAEDVPEAIAQAYRMALQSPFGPAFVSIPEDDWDRQAPASFAADASPRRVDASVRASAAAVSAIVRAFAEAERPALVVGAGVDRDGASDAAIRLAERTGAAVFVAPFSSRCGFPERHRQFAGFLPPVRTGIVRALAPFDLVLVLGAPAFTYHVFTPGPAVAEGTTLIQLTDDPRAAASAVAGTAIVATLRETLEEVLSGLPPAPRPPATFRTEPNELAETEPPTGAFALQTLARVLPDDAVVVEEAPSHRDAMHERLPIARPGAFFAAASGSLGWALPAAVGAALARPSRRIVAVLGDGSALYAVQGLWTAARLGLPITFLILNNRGYAAMDRFGAYLGFAGAPSFELAGVDFVRAAESFGVRGVRPERAGDLESALRESFARPEPTLIDVHVDDGMGAIY